MTKDRIISETPDGWVIVQIPDNNFKVYGTWAGGYLDGDSWKFNSGISKVEQDTSYYYFIGVSGSCYKCQKGSYGFATGYGEGILNNFIKQANNQLILLENVKDWETQLTNK